MAFLGVFFALVIMQFGITFYRKTLCRPENVSKHKNKIKKKFKVVALTEKKITNKEPKGDILDKVNRIIIGK